jgi:hypothetical protein
LATAWKERIAAELKICFEIWFGLASNPTLPTKRLQLIGEQF